MLPSSYHSSPHFNGTEINYNGRLYELTWVHWDIMSNNFCQVRIRNYSAGEVKKKKQSDSGGFREGREGF